MEEVGKDYGEVIFDHLHAAAFQGNALGIRNLIFRISHFIF
jgi:hypothetical protein